MTSELDDYRRLERVCRDLAGRATMPEERSAMLAMAERYHAAIDSLQRGNRFADTVQTKAFSFNLRFVSNRLNLLGERGGTRTLDPMIKSPAPRPFVDFQYLA